MNNVSESYIKEGVSKFGILFSDIEKIGGFENFMYKFQRDGSDFVLRMGHSSHRTYSEVLGELEFLNYLHSNGINTVVPIVSEIGNYVERVEINDTEHLTFTAFEWATGIHLKFQEIFSWPDIAEEYGALIGRMHQLTRSFQLSKGARGHFIDNPRFDPRKYLSARDDTMIHAIEEHINYLRLLPKDPEAYGLIHEDVHAGNFFIDPENENVIQLFDFDDCEFTWFITDLAVVLYYPLYETPFAHDPETQQKWLNDFYPKFIRGYRREYTLNQYWMDQLQEFIKLRDMLLYVIIHEMMDVENNEKLQASIAFRRERILGNKYIAIPEA